MSGNPYRCRASWHIAKHHGICTNDRVFTEGDAAEDFCASPDVDVASDYGAPVSRPACTQSDLLENQAIRTDIGAREYHDAIRMRNEQTSADLAA